MSPEPKKKKWKDALLKSSLPLEYLLTDKLEKLGIHVAGEYSFWRVNENKVNTEFSVDLWAFDFLEEDKQKDRYWAAINFLIECKYSHPTVKWVFSPFPEEQEEDMLIGVIAEHQDFAITRIETDPLYLLDEEIDYCIKGIELHDDNCNPNRIEHGLNQLKYGVVQLTKDRLVEQIASRYDSELNIEFICPILVTTAPLYVLNTGLSLEMFQQAEEIQSIAKAVDAVVVSSRIGVELKRYIKNIEFELRQSWPIIDDRLKNMAKILSDSEYKGFYYSNSFFLDSTLGRCATKVLIVNYEAFDKIIKKIMHLVVSTNSTLKRYATLEYDKEARKVFIKSI